MPVKITDRINTVQPARDSRRTRRFSVFTAGLVLFAARAGAQEAPAQQQPPVIKATTEVVSVYAVVEEGKGRLIPDLTKDDFEISDNDKPQTLKYFSRQTDTPLTMAILIDTSPSEQGLLPIEQEQADAFLKQIIRPKDEACVIHFDVDVELLQDFTSDVARLNRAVDQTVINGGGQGPTPGTFPGDNNGATHLFDAIYLASHDELRNEVGRQVIILLTDGEDQGSNETLNNALEAAQKADVIIYSIFVTARQGFGMGGMGVGGPGGSVLNKISEETGGRVIQVRRAKDMSEAFQQIASELRTQYLLGYTPDPLPTDTSFHRIKVQVTSGHYKVHARRGYYPRTD
jgi:VWFA-related protein